MISTQNFIKLLKANKVPYYAYPKYEPNQIFEHYNFGSMVGSRQISTQNSSRFNRKTESYSINKVAQQRIWQKLIKPTNIVFPYIISITSSVNDYLAHEVTSMLLLAIIRNYRTSINWVWTTPKFDPYSSNKMSMTVKPDIVIIRNILPIKERLYQIRDILDFYQESMRIVVLGGIDGIDFFDNYLQYPLNGAIHITGYKGKTPREFWVKDQDNTMLGNESFHVPVFLQDKLGKTIIQNFRIPKED